MMTKNTQIGQYSHQGVLGSVVIHRYTLAPNHGCGRIMPMLIHCNSHRLIIGAMTYVAIVLQLRTCNYFAGH